MALFENPFGHFSDDGREYIITRPDTPVPWVNVISNGQWGLTCSNAGGGCSWRDNANLNRITRWNQDLVADASGKWLYLTDLESGQIWSPTRAPAGAHTDGLRCTHGLGYSRFAGQCGPIACRLTLTVPPDDPCEVWIVRLRNTGRTRRALWLSTYFEWQLGPDPEGNREFHKLFIETGFTANRLWATKRLNPLPGLKEPWNTDYPDRPFFGCSRPITDYTHDKTQFLGRNGDWAAPRLCRPGGVTTCQQAGAWGDGVCATRQIVELEPDAEQELLFVLGGEEHAERPAGSGAMPYAARHLDAAPHAARHLDADGEPLLQEIADGWRRLLRRAEVATPAPELDLLSNDWLKYQAISCRINGRAAYYQSSGAYGFRDQLQDSLIYLHLEPPRTRERILDHAAHQHADGTVLHWWHNLSQTGPRSRFSDDLLWLPYVIHQYVLETGSLAILDERAPYLDEAADTVDGHCRRAIDRALARRSARGLPLIGEGDWNDGLSSCGDEGRGESAWVAHFLCRVLADYAALLSLGGREAQARTYLDERRALAEAVNTHCWDGAWYWRATLDDGTVIGSRHCAEGQIYLNPQTWAIIAETVPPERLAPLVEAVRTHLDRDHGPLLLHPAYGRPDARIGYITRYPAGLRENGGVYTHAACWAIMAAARIGDGAWAYSMFQKLCPPLRGAEPERYRAEPYVTPGNVDGPDSPLYGRGGWTWYTGSAAWLYRVLNEWILGIRPERDGLLIQPLIPSAWPGFRATRIFRGRLYRIDVSRGAPLLALNGKELDPGRPLLGERDENHVQLRIPADA